LDPFALGIFGDFIPKEENVNIISKRGKFDLGGVFMMVSIQASVSGSNSVNFCNFILALYEM
jgi:methenyltetrahydromethanopterin cyclohydrolase